MNERDFRRAVGVRIYVERAIGERTWSEQLESVLGASNWRAYLERAGIFRRARACWGELGNFGASGGGVSRAVQFYYGTALHARG
jgi:hypothetical protein